MKLVLRTLVAQLHLKRHSSLQKNIAPSQKTQLHLERHSSTYKAGSVLRSGWLGQGLGKARLEISFCKSGKCLVSVYGGDRSTCCLLACTLTEVGLEIKSKLKLQQKKKKGVGMNLELQICLTAVPGRERPKKMERGDCKIQSELLQNSKTHVSRLKRLLSIHQIKKRGTNHWENKVSQKLLERK